MPSKYRQDASYTEPSTPSYIDIQFDLDDPPSDTSTSVRVWYKIDASAIAASSRPLAGRLIMVRLVHDFYPDSWEYFEPRVYIPGGVAGDTGVYTGEFVIDNFTTEHMRLEITSPYDDNLNPISVNVVAYQYVP